MQDPDVENEIMVEVGVEMAGMRLDAVLAKAYDALSRSRIKDLIQQGAVRVGALETPSPNYRVRAGETIVLVAPPLADADPRPEDIPLDVLFEDNDLIVLDKPAGMVVHPAPGNPSGTLVNALLHHCGESLLGIGGVRRPGIVHRLDKDTSGVLVVAKTEKAHKHLAAQFADHGRTGALHRAYTAYVWGATQAAGGTVDAPLSRDQHNRLKQAVRREGREAVTHYTVEQRFGAEGWDITRLRCELETGRTHQIRVHMVHIGHPIVADPVYATGFATKVNRLPAAVAGALGGLRRQALHAAELDFVHPRTGETMQFSSQLPEDLELLDLALGAFDRAKADR